MSQPHAAHLGKLPAPAQYEVVELFRGTMTKHNLIAYRKDYPGELNPIQFEEQGTSSRSRDRWQHDIPLRLPWTLWSREHLPPHAPPDTVAVAINRAHTYPDLALPMNATQNRLLEAIDGKSTLHEIIQITGEGNRKKQALNFFRRLWQYDQIVFDASHRA